MKAEMKSAIKEYKELKQKAADLRRFPAAVNSIIRQMPQDVTRLMAVYVEPDFRAIFKKVLAELQLTYLLTKWGKPNSIEGDFDGRIEYAPCIHAACPFHSLGEFEDYSLWLVDLEGSFLQLDGGLKLVNTGRSINELRETFFLTLKNVHLMDHLKVFYGGMPNLVGTWLEYRDDLEIELATYGDEVDAVENME